MFGCLRRIGCLVVILLAVAGWFTRDLWWGRARGLLGHEPGTATAAAGGWEPISQEGAQRGERAVRALAQPSGPVFVTLRAGDLASYAFLSLAPQLSERDERDTLLIGGTFDVLRPGLAQLHVRELRYGSFPLPERMIPAVVQRVRGRDARGAEPDALPVPMPPFIGDVRVARGKITLYRSTP